MARKSNASRTSQTEQSNPSSETGSNENRNGRSTSERSASSTRSQSRRGGSRSGGNRGGGNSRQMAQRRAEFQENIARAQRSRQSSGNVLLDAGSAMVDSVKQHPVPAALIGAGLAWLLLETRVAREAEMRLLEQARSAAGVVGEKFSDLAETAKEAYEEASESTQEAISAAAETMKERAATLAEYAQSGASSVASSVRSGASTIGEAAQAGIERSRDAIADAWEQHPLAVGASLLAAGVATGLMLPASVREGKMLGNAASNLTKTVTSKGSEILEKGKEVVSSSAELLAREAKRYGITAGGSRSRSGGRR